MVKSSKKILIIDDDEGILDAVKILLEFEGYEVDASLNWEYVMDMKNNYPDLILLDVLLSGKDGREICQKLKRKDETKNIPIIMLSAHPSAKESVRDFGADDFVSKPFEINDLITSIEKNLASAKSQ